MSVINHSEETKKKISLSMIGKNKGRKIIDRKGKPFTEEHKLKIGLSNKGKGGFIDGRSSNKSYMSWMMNKRNRLKRQLNKNGSFHTFGEWENLKAQYNWTCPHCQVKEPSIILTEDHIIPLSKGGSDNIENIQPLCRKCNSSKGNRINFSVNNG